MTGIVHELVGAAVGSLFRNRGAAFVAGVASHVVCDLIPHRDIDPLIDVPIAAGILGMIAATKGADSPAFAGAIGAIAPDTEHALSVFGVISEEQKLFPTHIDGGRFHGADTDTRLSQVIVGAAALAVLGFISWRKGGKRDEHGEDHQ